MSRRQQLAYSLFVVTATLLALVLVEACARGLVRLRTGQWPVTAAVTLYRNHLEVHGLFRRHPWFNVTGRGGASAEAPGKRATLNSQGYRSPERSAAKPADVRRVLCAGGSTTFDSLADRNETTWPWLLEQELRQRGLPVEVWNAGVPTWTSLENTIALLARDLELQPDILVVLQGFNDLQPAAHSPHDPTYESGHSERMLEALGFELEPPGLLARSVALERLRAIFGLEAAEPGSSPKAAFVSDHGLETYRRNLRTLVGVARTHGIEVLLVTQPLRPAPAETERDRRFLGEWLGLEGEAVERELTRANEVLLDVATAEATSAFDAVAAAEWRKEDFWDPVHFGTPGSEKLARLLAEPVAVLLRGDQR